MNACRSLTLLGIALLLDVGRADVGENSSFGNGGVPQELVQLFVVSDGQEDVSWDDSGLLVVLGGVSGKFENFSSKVFKDGCEVDGSSGSDSFGVVSMSEKSSNSSDGELKSGS